MKKERDLKGMREISLMITNEVCQLVHHLKACTYMYMLDHAHKCEYNTLACNYPMQDAPIRMHYNRQNNECTTSIYCLTLAHCLCIVLHKHYSQEGHSCL